MLQKKIGRLRPTGEKYLSALCQDSLVDSILAKRCIAFQLEFSAYKLEIGWSQWPRFFDLSNLQVDLSTALLFCLELNMHVATPFV